MPTVPLYSDPLVKQEAMPQARVSTDAPLEAFGGGRSLEGVSNAAQGLTDTVRKYMEEEKQKADQTQLIATDAKYSDLQAKIQLKASKMQGQDAAAVPDMVKQEWENGVKEIDKGLVNRTQQMAAFRAATGRWDELNKFAQVHAQSEMEKFADNTAKGYIETSRNSATLNAQDDQKVGAEVQRQEAVLRDLAKRKGYLYGSDGKESEIFKSQLAETLSSTHHDVINARLDSGDDAGAKNYFEAHKDQLTDKDLNSATKLIDARETISQGIQAYDKVKDFKLSDGQPDETKMREAIMNRADLSSEKKLKIWDFVKARSNEDIVNKAKKDAATDRNFMNNVIEARKQGQPLEEALKLVDKFGSDDYDKAMREEAIKKVYAPPTQSDPSTYIDLWERTQDGSATKPEIDEAFQKNKINANDWRSLREGFHKIITDGKNPETKATWDRVKALADEKFGSNKIKREEFLYEMHTSGQGKSNDEIWKTANDKLKNAPGSGWFGTNMFADQQWKVDVKRHDAENVAWGKLHEDVGKDVVNAIGKGVLYQGKDKWNMGDVDAFAAQFGGYDKIKVGTPTNNAMQSLVKKNKLVTPANVKAVLERYPNGNF